MKEIVDKLTDEQKSILCLAINMDGEAGPVCNGCSLKFFKKDYAAECLKKLEPYLKDEFLHVYKDLQEKLSE